jgi:hypothetical protein
MQLASVASRERILQRVKAHRPVFGLMDSLSINEGVRAIELSESGGDRLESCGPILSRPRQKCDRAFLKAREQTIAIELYLMHPTGSFRRRAHQRCELGRYEIRRCGRRLASAGTLSRPRPRLWICRFRCPLPVAFGDRIHTSSRGDTLLKARQSSVAVFVGVVVLTFDQKPVLALRIAPAVAGHTDEVPATL